MTGRIWLWAMKLGNLIKKCEQAMGGLLRPVSLTSGAQKCVQVCSMDQSEGREEKPHHPYEKNHWKRAWDVPTWRSNSLEPEAGASSCHMHFWNSTDLLKVFYVVQKGCGNFWMSLKPTPISKLTPCLPNLFIRDSPLTNPWKQKKKSKMYYFLFLNCEA